jgi:hypothetical protein
VYGSLLQNNLKFSQVLTGYAKPNAEFYSLDPPSNRSIFCGYRARKLPLRYGQLGIDKWRIAELLNAKFTSLGFVDCDIDYSESARLYGKDWTNFLRSSRSTFGTESGCNVFDFSGSLESNIDKFKRLGYSDVEILNSKLSNCTFDGLMNQISPRIFEAISNRSALILANGRYSGILRPYDHYIPLEHDLGNFEEAIDLLVDNEFVDTMTLRAYEEIVCNEKYTWDCFRSVILAALMSSIPPNAPDYLGLQLGVDVMLTTHPLRPRDPVDLTSGGSVISLLLRNRVIASLNEISLFNSLAKKLLSFGVKICYKIKARFAFVHRFQKSLIKLFRKYN